MKAIFKQAKVEQENADRAFEEEEAKKAVVNTGNPNKELESDVLKAIVESKPNRGSRKTSNQLTVTEEVSSAKKKPKLVKGSAVRIISGSFLGFEGTLKKLNRKTKIVSFLLH